MQGKSSDRALLDRLTDLLSGAAVIASPTGIDGYDALDIKAPSVWASG
jgi:hypothetical protein